MPIMAFDPPPPPSGPVELSAGPLSLSFENGYVHHIRIGDSEIVRRIYMALRDEHWNTIPGEISDFSLVNSGDAFSLAFTSRHRRNDVDFIWRAEIEGLASGELSYVMRGTALSGFRRNRIGLCVLHPLSSCKGQPCRIGTIDGTLITAAFPEAISPHQIFQNVRSQNYSTSAGQGVELRFEGDVFETEDQRNWTDASYKTYSTPLSLPFPVFIDKGATIFQKITVVPVDPPRKPASMPRPGPVFIEFNFARPLRHTLPSIGMMEPSLDCDAPFNPPALRHLRVDLRPGSGDIAARVTRARRLHRDHRAPIELALHFSGDCAKEAVLLATLIAESPFPIARILVFHEHERATSHSTVIAVLDTLRRCCPAAPIVGGTDGYFVEINRVRPPVDLLDGVCWSANPQVHTFDDAAIMENLPGIQETLLAARSFFDGKKSVISPLTLSPRKNAGRPLKDGGPDIRMDKQFGAAWTIGAIAGCIEGDASSLTFGETNGSSPAGELLSWLPPRASAATCVSSDPSQVCGFELRDAGKFMAFAANLTNAYLTVLFNGLPENCRYSILDEASFGKAASLPDPAGRIPVEKALSTNGAVSITLPPYGIVRFVDGSN